MLRIRFGDYRIIYRVHDEVLTVLVVTVGHRRNVYRRRELYDRSGAPHGRM